MRKIIICCLLIVFTSPLFSQEIVRTLDPKTMVRNETGKLPKTGNGRAYYVGRVIDDEDVLIGMEDGNRRGLFVARFFIRDPQLVKQFKDKDNGTKFLNIPIELNLESSSAFGTGLRTH